MVRRRTNPDFLNGVPELLILRLLCRQPMHGYELVEAIRLASGEALQFGEGCVYPVLHRLQKQRMLASRRQTVSWLPEMRCILPSLVGYTLAGAMFGISEPVRSLMNPAT